MDHLDSNYRWLAVFQDYLGMIRPSETSGSLGQFPKERGERTVPLRIGVHAVVSVRESNSWLGPPPPRLDIVLFDMIALRFR